LLVFFFVVVVCFVLVFASCVHHIALLFSILRGLSHWLAI